MIEVTPAIERLTAEIAAVPLPPRSPPQKTRWAAWAARKRPLGAKRTPVFIDDDARAAMALIRQAWGIGSNDLCIDVALRWMAQQTRNGVITRIDL